MASVRWTVGAREDLRGTVYFVSRYSEMYGAALAARIVSSVDRLETFPMLGRMVPSIVTRISVKSSWGTTASYTCSMAPISESSLSSTAAATLLGG